MQVVCPAVQHLLALFSQTGEVCIQDGHFGQAYLTLARAHNNFLDLHDL